MGPRTVTLLGRGSAVGRSTMIVAAMIARLVPARLVARLAMTMTMRTARLFGLDLLGVGQFRQIMRQSGDLVADQPFDVAQIATLRRIAERERDARTAGARGAADAVDIAFRLVGQLEI